VPDSEIDLTDLWEEVRMAKSKKDSEKGTSKGTAAYDDVLYRLGIDIMESPGHLTKPEDILDRHTDTYDNIRTNEQLEHVAEVLKRLAGLNEATIAARMMQYLFLFADPPDEFAKERSWIPWQILEFYSAFEKFDKFNRSLYAFVREQSNMSTNQPDNVIYPYESELKSRADMIVMVHTNAVQLNFREVLGTYPGVHADHKGCAPFLSVEFKSSADKAKKREAKHQVAISSYVCLVERQRIPRINGPDYLDDSDLRHYAYTICGTKATIWVTTLRQDRKHTIYEMNLLTTLDLGFSGGLEKFLGWHRTIMAWGLLRYAPSYVTDIEAFLGQDRRESIANSLLSAMQVTTPEGQPHEITQTGLRPITEEKSDEIEPEEQSATGSGKKKGKPEQSPPSPGSGKKKGELEQSPSSPAGKLMRSGRIIRDVLHLGKRSKRAAEEQTDAEPNSPTHGTN
jgi:hypothetical protein